jgi:signal transduction histidine kinase
MNQTGLNNIALTIYIGIGVMLVLIISFLIAVLMSQRRKWKMLGEMQKLKEEQQNQLIEGAVRSEEGERHRISELLHDEVGALLSSSRIYLVEMKTDQLSQDDQQDHAKVKELLDESIKKVRSISHNLHSTILKEFGLNEAIRHFMKTVTGGSTFTSLVDLDEEYQLSNSETDLAVYRIIQELVNNLIKHAHPVQIKIQSALGKNKLKITIYHNGDGLSQERFEELRFKHDGLGLKNIQNRIILLRGAILFEVKNPGDNYIYLTIPLQL